MQEHHSVNGFLNLYFWGAAGASCAAGEGKLGAEVGSTAGRGSVLHKRPSPTAAKQQSRAGLVAATRVNTSQWLLDRSQWRGKSEIKSGSQAGGSGSSSERYMARHRHGCNSSGKGKEGVSKLKKSSWVMLGSPNEISYSFLMKLSPQQPDSRLHHCMVSELALNTGCQTHRSSAWLLALAYILVKVCVIFSYISFFCIELEDDSDTPVLNTVIKLEKFS